MTTCSELSDRMVDIAHGRGAWTAAQAGHLAACAECGAEWVMVCAARDAGDGPALDAGRVAARVRDRLRRAETLPTAPLPAVAGRRDWRGWAVGLAAAAVLIVAVGLEIADRPPVVAPVDSTVVAEADDLTPRELERLLDDMGEPAAPAMPEGAVGLSDLTAAELERVLTFLES